MGDQKPSAAAVHPLKFAASSANAIAPSTAQTPALFGSVSGQTVPTPAQLYAQHSYHQLPQPLSMPPQHAPQHVGKMRVQSQGQDAANYSQHQHQPSQTRPWQRAPNVVFGGPPTQHQSLAGITTSRLNLTAARPGSPSKYQAPAPAPAVQIPAQTVPYQSTYLEVMSNEIYRTFKEKLSKDLEPLLSQSQANGKKLDAMVDEIKKLNEKVDSISNHSQEEAFESRGRMEYLFGLSLYKMDALRVEMQHALGMGGSEGLVPNLARLAANVEELREAVEDPLANRSASAPEVIRIDDTQEEMQGIEEPQQGLPQRESNSLGKEPARLSSPTRQIGDQPIAAETPAPPPRLITPPPPAEETRPQEDDNAKEANVRVNNHPPITPRVGGQPFIDLKRAKPPVLTTPNRPEGKPASPAPTNTPPRHRPRNTSPHDQEVVPTSYTPERSSVPVVIHSSLPGNRSLENIESFGTSYNSSRAPSSKPQTFEHTPYLGTQGQDPFGHSIGTRSALGSGLGTDVTSPKDVRVGYGVTHGSVMNSSFAPNVTSPPPSTPNELHKQDEKEQEDEEMEGGENDKDDENGTGDQDVVMGEEKESELEAEPERSLPAPANGPEPEPKLESEDDMECSAPMLEYPEAPTPQIESEAEQGHVSGPATGLALDRVFALAPVRLPTPERVTMPAPHSVPEREQEMEVDRQPEGGVDTEGEKKEEEDSDLASSSDTAINGESVPQTILSIDIEEYDEDEDEDYVDGDEDNSESESGSREEEDDLPSEVSLSGVKDEVVSQKVQLESEPEKADLVLSQVLPEEREYEGEWNGVQETQEGPDQGGEGEEEEEEGEEEQEQEREQEKESSILVVKPGTLGSDSFVATEDPRSTSFNPERESPEPVPIVQPPTQEKEEEVEGEGEGEGEGEVEVEVGEEPKHEQDHEEQEQGRGLVPGPEISPVYDDLNASSSFDLRTSSVNTEGPIITKTESRNQNLILIMIDDDSCLHDRSLSFTNSRFGREDFRLSPRSGAIVISDSDDDEGESLIPASSLSRSYSLGGGSSYAGRMSGVGLSKRGSISTGASGRTPASHSSLGRGPEKEKKVYEISSGDDDDDEIELLDAPAQKSASRYLKPLPKNPTSSLLPASAVEKKHGVGPVQSSLGSPGGENMRGSMSAPTKTSGGSAPAARVSAGGMASGKGIGNTGNNTVEGDVKGSSVAPVPPTKPVSIEGRKEGTSTSGKASASGSVRNEFTNDVPVPRFGDERATVIKEKEITSGMKPVPLPKPVSAEGRKKNASVRVESGPGLARLVPGLKETGTAIKTTEERAKGESIGNKAVAKPSSSQAALPMAPIPQPVFAPVEPEADSDVPDVNMDVDTDHDAEEPSRGDDCDDEQDGLEGEKEGNSSDRRRKVLKDLLNNSSIDEDGTPIRYVSQKSKWTAKKEQSQAPKKEPGTSAGLLKLKALQASGQSAATTRIKRKKKVDEEPPLTQAKKRSKLDQEDGMGFDVMIADAASSSKDHRNQRMSQSTQSRDVGAIKKLGKKKELKKSKDFRDSPLYSQYVECEGECKSWYHLACAGLRSVEEISQDGSFRCTTCKFQESILGSSKSNTNGSSSQLGKAYNTQGSDSSIGSNSTQFTYNPNRDLNCALPDCPILNETQDDQVAFIDKVVGRSRETQTGRMFWLVKWHGYDISEATWEPEEEHSLGEFCEKFKVQAIKERKWTTDERKLILLQEAEDASFGPPERKRKHKHRR